MTLTIATSPSFYKDTTAVEALFPKELLTRALPLPSRIQGPLDIGTYSVSENEEGSLIDAGGWT